MGTLIYHKAFVVNTKIINSIEKYEGYNKYSSDEIDRSLMSIGYPNGEIKKCPKKHNNLNLSTQISKKYNYCVYMNENDGNGVYGSYYSYGVITYITIDFPLISSFLKIPVYTESNRIYKFS